METFAELAVVGDVVQDEDKVMCLLASLPDDYCRAWLTQHDQYSIVRNGYQLEMKCLKEKNHLIMIILKKEGQK